MKVKFIKDVDISGKIFIDEGEIYEAVDNGDSILIKIKDISTVVAPKSEIDDVLEIIE